MLQLKRQKLKKKERLFKAAREKQFVLYIENPSDYQQKPGRPEWSSMICLMLKENTSN